MSSPLEFIKPIFSKLSSIFPNTYSTNSSNDPNATNTSASIEDNTIDIQKTFSSENINITPIIKTILELHSEFPSNILNTKAGHKYNELEFFQSNQDSNATNNTKTNSNALFEKFNRTHTQLGKTLLQSIILEPTINVSGILKHRQAIATAFMKHPQLAAIRKTLEECSKLEHDILAMQMTDTPEMEEVYKVIFFQFRGLQNFNYHELFLKVFYYFIIIFSPIYGIVGPFVFMLTPYVFMRYVFKIPLPFETFFSILKKMVLGGTGFFSNLNKIMNSGIGKVAEQMMTGGGAGGGEGGSGGISIKSVVISMVKWIVAFMNSTGGTYVYLGFIICTYLYGIYNSIQVSITYNKIINMFHSRLNIISKWLKGAVNFYKMGLGFDFPEISPLISQMSSLMSNPTIINLLNHDTFKSEPGLLTNKGIIIKTFKEFLDMKTLLAPFCKYMAHIDIWTGIGKWLQEGYGVDRTICSFEGGGGGSGGNGGSGGGGSDLDTSSSPFIKGQATNRGASTTIHSFAAHTFQSLPVKTDHLNSIEEPTCQPSTNSLASARSMGLPRFRSTTKTTAMLARCRSTRCWITSKPHSQPRLLPPTCTHQGQASTSPCPRLWPSSSGCSSSLLAHWPPAPSPCR